MKYLILLNRKFPYKTGEAFLENEIDEIAKSFDRIMIYPLDVCLVDNCTRTINSPNVEVKVLEKRSLKRRKIGYFFRAVSTVLKSSENSLIRKLVDRYFIIAAKEQAKTIFSDIEKIEFQKEDEIYIYSYWLYITAYVAKMLSEYFLTLDMDVKVFSRAHRFDIYEEKRKYSFLPQQRKLIEAMDRVFPCSDDGSSYLKKKYPEFENKIITAYLGTYDHGIGSFSNRRPLKIVSCSRVSDVKRVDLIIDALDSLRDQGLSIEWTHLGGGELLEQLKKKSEVLDWMRVNFVGAIPNTEVYEYYRNNDADLFINVSSSEGLPVSIMEATSFGIPVIATNVGGTGEIVVDGESGMLIDPDFAIEELANSIKRIAIMSTEEYVKLRESTRALWEKYYQANKNYAKFVNCILGLDF